MEAVGNNAVRGVERPGDEAAPEDGVEGISAHDGMTRKRIGYRAHRAACFRRALPPRNSWMRSAMKSPESSMAKWPESRRWSSAFGRSFRKAFAPATVKNGSFCPQTIRVRGCLSRKY